MSQNNLIYSCSLGLSYLNIVNKPNLKKNKNKLSFTNFIIQNKKVINYLYTKKTYRFSTNNLVKNTVAFEKWKKVLFFFSKLNFDFSLVTFGKTKKNPFVLEKISLKQLSELNNDFVSISLVTQNDFYWFSITFNVVAEANENAIKALLNIDKLPTLIKYNLELIKPGWGIRYIFLIKSNKQIIYESEDKKITCGTFRGLQFNTKTSYEGDHIIHSETDLNWIELNLELTNLKININKDYLYYKTISLDKSEFFKCILGKHKKIKLKEFELLREKLPTHRIYMFK
jgi:hypothetical protein